MLCGDIDDEIMCRLCLSEKGDFIPIFMSDHSESSMPPLVEKISLCTEVQVRVEDGFPNFICHHCLYQIEIWFSFKQLCLRSDSFLHKEAKKNIILDFNTPVQDQHQPLISPNHDVPSLTANVSSNQSSQNRTEGVPNSIENVNIENESSSAEILPVLNCSQLVSAPTRVYSRLRRVSCNLCKSKFSNHEDLESHQRVEHQSNSIESINTFYCSENQGTPKIEVVTSAQPFNVNINMSQDNIEVEGRSTSLKDKAVETATIVLNATSLSTIEDKVCLAKSPKMISQLSLKYKKANLYPCPFCGTFIQRISRHIETQHSNEPDVKKLMSLEKKSVDRHRLLENLRARGILNHTKRIKGIRKKENQLV